MPAGCAGGILLACLAGFQGEQAGARRPPGWAQWSIQQPIGCLTETN
jgi:hypothetical protein